MFLVVFFDRNFVTAGHGSCTSWIDVQSVRTSAVRTSALAFCCLNSKSRKCFTLAGKHLVHRVHTASPGQEILTRKFTASRPPTPNTTISSCSQRAHEVCVCVGGVGADLAKGSETGGRGLGCRCRPDGRCAKPPTARRTCFLTEVGTTFLPLCPFVPAGPACCGGRGPCPPRHQLPPPVIAARRRRGPARTARPERRISSPACACVLPQ